MDTPKRTLAEVLRTPVLALTEDEVAMLDADGQAFARNARAAKARQDACRAHERVSTSTREESNRGWHRGECRHCGKDMSWDSGD